MREISRIRKMLPLLVTFVLISLAGCGKKDGELVAPLKPFVRITGGPLEESTDSYTARIFWTGWDEDGIIEHYEYAADPPPVFSRDEIQDPVGSPGVSIRIIPGPAEHQDTLRVSKNSGGSVYSFDWVQTRDFSRAFAFSTPIPDSTVATGSLQPDKTWSGPHTVYVRALDNDELYSDVEEIGYTAKTFTPTATIARPNISAELSSLGTTVTIGWDGLDPDSPDANKKPVGYLYKMLRLDTLEPKIPIQIATEQRLYDRGGGWTYQRADSLRKTFQLAPGGQYLFGVRAVDVAGAEEPFLKFGRNTFKFQAFADGGRPILTVCEPAFKCFVFRGIDKPVEVDVPTGKILRFSWSASAETYGGQINGYSWGYDIPDLERPEGWSVWGDIPNSDPRTFRTPGVHVFYVRARDESGTMALGAVILNIIQFSFEREILWVDDYKDSVFPIDAEHDAFWRRRFQDYPGQTEYFEFQAESPQDPRVPSLEEMGRYKLLVWENTVGFGGQSALLSASTLRPTLGSYLGAGGKLWIGGRITVTAMLPSPNGVGADLNYPKEEIVAGDFAYDFMKLRTTLINREIGNTQKNFFVGVRPYPGKPALYDSMSVDVTKLRQPFQFALTHVDAVFGPIFAENDPTFVGDIDSVYAYRTYGNEVTSQPSSYQNKLVGLRWHDDNPVRLHGRIQWFGFPMYYMFEDQAQKTFNRSLDWFRQEITP